MNPYATYLGNRNPREAVEETPARLKAYVERLGADEIERGPAAGKWSVREVLCHLADCEIVFGFRLRQALAESHHVIEPFDQDIWAAAYASPSLDAQRALDAFSAARRWNIAFLDLVEPGQLSKPLSHPERGQMTFQTLVETMAGHDLNHIAQIERIGTALRQSA